MFRCTQRFLSLVFLYCLLCWGSTSDVLLANAPSDLNENACEGIRCVIDDVSMDMNQYIYKRRPHKSKDIGGNSLLQISHGQKIANGVTSDIGSEMTAPMSQSVVTAKMNISINSAQSMSMLGKRQPVNTSDVTRVFAMSRVRCGESMYSPEGACPKSCPYFAEEGGKSRVCYFKCVKASQCGSLPLQESHDVADHKHFVCRRCQVLGCVKCSKAQGDVCEICENGMFLLNGQCFGNYGRLWHLLFLIGGSIMVFMLCWLVRLELAEVTNKAGLDEGLAFRSSLKLRVPKAKPATDIKPVSQTQWQREVSHIYHTSLTDHFHVTEVLGRMNLDDESTVTSLDSVPTPPVEQDAEAEVSHDIVMQPDFDEHTDLVMQPEFDEDAEEPPLWPIPGTNLHFAQVAGPGLTLHMNFQVAIILFGSVVASAWVFFAYFTHPDVLFLGLAEMETRQQLCGVTVRGYQSQQKVMSAKVIFLVFMLLAWIVFNLIFSLHQRQCALALENEARMGDFAAVCSGLPEFSGEQKAEDELKEFIQEEIGIKVIGVSLCWDYRKICGQVEKANAHEVWLEEARRLEDELPKIPDQETLDAKKSFLQKHIFGYVDMLFGFTGKVREVKQYEHETDLEELLKKLKSTSTAFVVFETEGARDKAIQMFKTNNATGGPNFKGVRINLSWDKKMIPEPDTVQWGNFNVSNTQFACNVFLGIILLVGSLALWALCCYMPAAMYRAAYARQGQEPPIETAMVFTVLVIGGNQVMYTVSRFIAEKVGFQSTDRAEAFYIILYTFSCFANVLTDMALEYMVTLDALFVRGAHTADGRLLQDMNSNQEIFESYLMQKELGMRLFTYCFPTTFLLPFIGEAIFSIYVPFRIQKMLLRTHPEVRGQTAEQSMEFFAPMDLGRYGDIVLNMMLSSIVVFFPPGTFLKMYLALVMSHLYIYFYDYYRILRCVPKFNFSTDNIDRMVQILMGVPTAILGAGIVFKACSRQGTPVSVNGWALVFMMLAAAVVCMLLQIIIVKFIVPLFDKEHVPSDTSYAELAVGQPSNWFSENPLFCLRSKFIYKHDPPCLYNARGKSWLIRPNPEIGIYFKENQKSVAMQSLWTLTKQYCGLQTKSGSQGRYQGERS